MPKIMPRPLKKADDKTIQEIQLTNDGQEFYSFSRRLRAEDIKELQKQEKDRKDFRRPAIMISGHRIRKNLPASGRMREKWGSCG